MVSRGRRHCCAAPVLVLVGAWAGLLGDVAGDGVQLACRREESIPIHPSPYEDRHAYTPESGGNYGLESRIIGGCVRDIDLRGPWLAARTLRKQHKTLQIIIRAFR